MGDGSDASDEDEAANGGMQRDMEEIRLAEDMYLEFDTLPVGSTRCVLTIVYMTLMLKCVNRRVNARTRRDRTERITQAWDEQMAKLVDAYLRYECSGAPAAENEGNYPPISLIDIIGSCIHW